MLETEKALCNLHILIFEILCNTSKNEGNNRVYSWCTPMKQGILLPAAPNPPLSIAERMWNLPLIATAYSAVAIATFQVLLLLV